MDYDNMLYRSLAHGTEYNNLIPKPKYNKVLIGEGNTDYSIKEMAELVQESSHECQLLAQKLQASSLKDCIANVKDFAYNNFQYHADDADQMLRTLAYSWWVDKITGIDCKSYSIIVSSLLTEMGINHYIRKIKQPGFAPTEYTHVYVVVPMDQQTNLLQNGYYTVDGTLKTDIEPAFVGTKDKFMPGLQHYKLNGALDVFSSNQANGNQSIDFSSIIKKISISSLRNVYSQFYCGLVQSAYGYDLLEQQITKLNTFFHEIIVSMANNISKANYKELANDLSDFLGYSECLYSGSNLVDGYGDWNSCTTDNLHAFEAAARFYRFTVYEALLAYINKYFDKTVAGKYSYTNVGLENQGWVFVEIEGHPWTPEIEYYNLIPKYGLTTIPAFEFTQPLVDAVSHPLDLPKFLNSLSTTITLIKTVTNPGNAGNAGNEGNGNGGNIDSNLPPSNTTSTAGFGWVAGIAIVLIGYSLATSKKELVPNNKNTK